MAAPLHNESPMMKTNNSGTSERAFLAATAHIGGFGRSNYPLPHVHQGRTRPTGNAQAPSVVGSGSGS